MLKVWVDRIKVDLTVWSLVTIHQHCPCSQKHLEAHQITQLLDPGRETNKTIVIVTDLPLKPLRGPWAAAVLHRNVQRKKDHSTKPGRVSANWIVFRTFLLIFLETQRH